MVCMYSYMYLVSIQGSWLHGSWIYNYMCNQCLSPLRLWGWILLKARCTRYNIMCQWFSPGTRISSTNKTDRHNITEILLKVALNTITLTLGVHTCTFTKYIYMHCIHTRSALSWATKLYFKGIDELIIAKRPVSSISAIFRTRTSSIIF